MKAATKSAVPKTLGACADRLYAIKAEVNALNKQIDQLKAEASSINDHLINVLPKDDARGIFGKVARAVITTKQVASVKDWEAFYKHILKTKDFSLMQRRVADTAVRERWDGGERVPGVEPFTVKIVSLNKV